MIQLWICVCAVHFIRRWLSLQILKSLEPWERCVFVSVSVYEGVYLKCWLLGGNGSSGVCLRFPSEAFVPWLRGDLGLSSEPCSTVRQRWKHLRQRVYPVCREAVSTRSCSSSHTCPTSLKASCQISILNSPEGVGKARFIWLDNRGAFFFSTG